MKYMFILLVLFIVIVPAVSAIRRAKSLQHNIDLEARLKELQELAEKEKQEKEKKEPNQPRKTE